MAFFRRPVRSRPVRLFLISMFAVPLVSLLALWGFAASITVSNAISDHEYNVSTAAINAGVRGLTIGLPQERVQSYLWLIGGRKTAEEPVLASRKLVDQGIPVARTALFAEQGLLSAESRSALNTLFTKLGQLGKIRTAIDSGAMSPSAAFSSYSDIIDELFLYFDSSIQDRGASLTGVSVGASDSAYAFEMTSREVALVDGALLGGGLMSADIGQQFASSAANRRLLMNESLALLTPSLRAGFVSIEGSAPYQEFQAMESQILASIGGAGPLPVNPATWQSASGAVMAGMEKAETANGAQLTSMSASLSDRLVTEAVLAGGLGLAAVVASVFLLVWFGRKVTGDLGRLNDSVRGMAEERLPRVVERLRRGDDVDVLAESPPPGASGIQEISQVAESFGTVQAAAVAAAVDQAKLRKAVNQVFLNISMRNQSLLHRQLAMLDSMERRTSEPEALADLFRLDHLTTRMRRHAEGLIILSGSTPGRGWRDPVPVVDVLRAAVAEVEDYVRVDVTSESDDLVAGTAVNDVIHLVAELVENATVFSPPNTRIEVRAERVGTGLVAEVEDRGLGLSAEELADINQRLASTPEFDLARSEQLGLFVVSQLAARHDVKVSLRRSVYGGTTAVVLMPFGVVVRKEDAGPPGDRGDRLADGGARGLTGRHRLPAVAQGHGTDARTAEWPAVPGTGALAPWERGTPALPAALPAAPAPAPWDRGATAPWLRAFQPGAFQPGAFQPEPSRPDEPGGASPREPGQPGPASHGSHLGMPIRVPQANLAPQLRASRDAAAAPAGRDAPDAGARSPEATRNMLNLMQRGWQHGRVDDLDNPEGAPGNGTD